MTAQVHMARDNVKVKVKSQAVTILDAEKLGTAKADAVGHALGMAYVETRTVARNTTAFARGAKIGFLAGFKRALEENR